MIGFADCDSPTPPPGKGRARRATDKEAEEAFSLLDQAKAKESTILNLLEDVSRSQDSRAKLRAALKLCRRATADLLGIIIECRMTRSGGG